MIARLLRLYRPYTGWLLLGTLLALIALLANVGLLALSGWFITSMALAGVAGVSMNYFTPAAVIRGLAIARTAGRYGERIVTHEATFRLIAGLRVWFYERIEPLAPAALQARRSGEVLSRLQKDIDRLDAVYLRIALPIIVAVIAAVLFTLFMAMHSPLLALVNLGFLLLGGLVLPLWINHRSGAPGRAQVQLAGEVRTQSIDGVQGMAELLAYGADLSHQQQLQQLDRQWRMQQDALNRVQSGALAGQALLSHLAVWTVLLLAIPMVLAAQLPPANLAMLALFTLAGFEAIAPLPAALGVLAETGEAARRLFELADTPALVSEPASAQLPPEQPDIRFDNVSLSYPGQQGKALKHIDLHLAPGSHTLVLGSSGAGKSSLINLLLRFNDPTGGRILVGDQELSQLSGEQWRSRIAVIAQHTQLIAGSIRDNLLLARPDASDSELASACERAHIRQFIESLPQGYDTWLGETGVKVSGGQARRIAIARALLKQAPVLLLDEPTEGLDRTTEKQVMESLQSLMRERTVLLITHRPIELGHIDQTITLDHGRICA